MHTCSIFRDVRTDFCQARPLVNSRAFKMDNQGQTGLACSGVPDAAIEIERKKSKISKNFCINENPLTTEFVSKKFYMYVKS